MFKKKTKIGIDIGSAFIKAVEAFKTKNGIYIKEFMKVEKKDDEEDILSLLKDIRLKMGKKNVVFGLPSKHIVYRNISLPKMNSKELKEAVYWEAQDFSMVIKDDFTFDYEIISENDQNAQILLAAASTAVIKEYIKIFEKAGFFVEAVDVYPLAVSRVFKEKFKEEVIVILDLGQSHSEAAILENGMLFFSKTFNFSVSSERSKIVEFIQEFTRFIDYYSIQRKGKQVEKIVLIGGGSKVSYIAGMLFENLSSEIIFARDLKPEELKVYALKNASFFDLSDYCNALGFAMRG
ncbi:MAG: type IV pilus biogenesis protein PilM [Thermovenabulum sp.]|uniref:type IV pilus biogenesis protein PilM n=1 Tax=Thermovenabulum sp. TaxID=3100335 RepID=UPI003C7BAAC0